MMTYSENQAFIKELQSVAEKHGLSIMYSNNPTNLVNQTKFLEGYHMFFTKGNDKIKTESVGNPSNLTINFSQNKTEEYGC